MTQKQSPQIAQSRPSESAGLSKREKIVLTAGHLFAAKGYHAVPMREIAKSAGVPLSLIVYHFTTKANLYRSAFEHFHGIFEERLSLLDRIEDFSAPTAVREIVEAFVKPVKEAQKTEEGRVYNRLVLREASDPEQEERGIIRDYYDPLARRFIEALKIALPNKPEDALVCGYLFSVSSLVMSHFEERTERLTRQDTTDEILNQKYEYLVRFICAGLEGL